MDWARVGALSVRIELWSRIISVAVPIPALAVSESRPVLRSNTLVSDDHIVRCGWARSVPGEHPISGVH